MNIYLEYKDEKSAKFWKIEVEDLAHTVTYGKIGTDGQQKTKTFDSMEAVTNAAEKLIKAKLKKGYKEVTTTKATPVKSSLLTEEAIAERFDLAQYAPVPADWNYDAFLLIEGDLVVEEGIDDSFINAAFFNGARTTERELIIVQGNLVIKGDLCIYGETGYPSLIVLGDLHCKNLDSNDNFIYVSGDAHIQYLYYGNYNHGAIKVAGTTHVPYLLNSDHHSELNPAEGTILINVYNDNDDSFDYDYYSSDLPRVLLEELLELEEEYDEEDEDFDEEDIEYDLDLAAFSKVIEQGKSPFKEGAKTKRAIIQDKIVELATENTAKFIDLTDKRLSEIPAALLQITALETLLLGKNELAILPATISQLTNLKELNLCKTDLEELPISIGELKNLEKLNLSHCYNLTSLPASIGQLKKLKVLDLSYCYQLKTLPATISQLSNLEKLGLLHFKGGVPDSIFDLPQIEELEILI